MPILNKTTLCSTKFDDGNGLHIRVYYQYTSDKVKESFYDTLSGWNLRGNGDVVAAKLNSPIAVVSWASGTQIRVYYLDPNDFICERAYEGGSTWVDGSLRTYGFQAAPFSQLAASMTERDGVQIGVYFQASDYSVQELKLKGRWSKDPRQIGTATPGTALAALGGVDASPGVWWIYYQDPTLRLKEMLCLSPTTPWIAGSFAAQGVFRPGAAIAVVAWGDVEIRVYAINEKNDVVETAWRGRWFPTTTITTAAVTDSGIGAIQWKDDRPNHVQIRLYFQRTGGIKEWCWNGTAWVEGSNIPLYP